MNKVEHSFARLEEFCIRENFKGWDPYDGLNSGFFNVLPFKHSRFFRLAWIQFFKKNPLNFRPIFGIKKGYNPKGLALFLSSYCNVYRLGIEKEPLALDAIKMLSNRLIENQSKGWSGSCWGYNFDWQSRAFFQPKYTPTVVATCYAGYALLDAYEITKDTGLLDIARSAGDFILKDLNRTEDKDSNFAFSYSPLDQTQVFNASLLGSRLLSRIYHFTGEEELISQAKKSVEFCNSYQNDDGSWAYGTLPFHQWIDNFHTGFNLECISEYMKYASDNSYEFSIKSGLKYYLNTFFTPEGIPKYYNNSTYPVDIHASAQLIITLSRLGVFKEHKELIDRVLFWTIDNMQDDKGYFYYQLRKNFNSRIPYIRWAQAWMHMALSTYLVEMGKSS